MKTVLCAIDISQPKLEANVLIEAVNQARSRDLGLDVITVLPDYGMSVVAGFFEKDHQEEATVKAKTLLDQTVSDVLGRNAVLDVRKIVATGTAYEKILEAAATTNTELIVIGAHKPNFQDYFLGPNAARVVRHAECSVYVVR